MSDYTPITPERILTVDQLYSVHYFEYSPSYKFFGERHDFWEFLYVDKGSLRVIADEEEHSLSRGQIIFHAPGEFHALSADGVVAPNIIVVSFRCDSPAMSAFHKRITVAGAIERVLLARIVDESTAVFSSPLNDPATYALQRRTSALGATHMTGGGDPFYQAIGYEPLIRWTILERLRVGSALE